MSRRVREKVTVPVGTRVRVPFPWHKASGFVVEHRGFIGVNGREMVRVKALHDDDVFSDCDFPAEELEVVPPPAQAPAVDEFCWGTRVRAHLPTGTVDGTVVEDRGLILDGEMRTVRIRTCEETYYINEFEIPSIFLEVLPPARRRRTRSAKR